MQVNINDIEWNIIYVNPLSVDLMRSDGTITLGMCDCNTNCIYISNALKGELLRKVIIHELVHAFMFSYNIYIPIETEELICDFIATNVDDIINMTESIIYDYIIMYA